MEEGSVRDRVCVCVCVERAFDLQSLIGLHAHNQLQSHNDTKRGLWLSQKNSHTLEPVVNCTDCMP